MENTLTGYIYPVAIFTARYHGTYEGATWLAFNEHVDDCKLNGVQGDDLACASFFEVYERFKPVGRGETPQEAYEDLYKKLEKEPEAAWPKR